MISRPDVINTIAVVGALGLAMIGGTLGAPDTPTISVLVGPDAPSELAVVTLDTGEQAIVDATGAAVPLREYRRIVSGTTVSDWILSELCEPDRVLSYTESSARNAPWRHKFAGKPSLASLSKVEAVLALKPDLVIMNSYGDPRPVARLRERGLQVFDLGEMRGAASVARAAHALGVLIDRRDLAAALASRFERDLTSLAADVPMEARRSAVYVSAYGKELFGGTVGTTYHEILTYAGLADAAAAAHRNWPHYTTEQLLALDPDLVVTRPGMGAALCSLAGLERLRACRVPASIVEVNSFILDDPGLGLLAATEAVYGATHGAAKR